MIFCHLQVTSRHRISAQGAAAGTAPAWEPGAGTWKIVATMSGNSFVMVSRLRKRHAHSGRAIPVQKGI